MMQLAVFGQPVRHSRSPQIHHLFGAQLGIAVDYRAIEAGVDELPERLQRFRDAGGCGANLTVPLKQAGLKLCRQVDRPARQAHAVNTLQWSGEGWRGYNTDGNGLLLDFDRIGIDLLDRRPERITILNRTAERAERLADKFAHRGRVDGSGFPETAALAGYDLMIQSTSAGHSSSLPPLDASWLSPEAVVYDLNYGEAHGPLARWCRQRDLPAHDGLGMLVGQAALAFEIWTDRRPDIAPIVAKLLSE